MSDARPQAVTATLAALLTPARQRLALAALRARLARRFEWALWSCVAAAVIEAAASAVCRLTNNALPSSVHVCAAVLIAAGAVVALVPPVATIRRRLPSWQQTAERLDAAHDEHNRIATAWSLAAHASDSPFAAAAVAQGVARLRTICDSGNDTPALPHEPGRLARKLAGGAAAIILAGLALALQLMPPRGSSASSDSRHVSTLTRATDKAGQEAAPQPKSSQPGVQAPVPVRVTAKGSGSADAASASADPRSPSRERNPLGVEPSSVAAAPGMSRTGTAGAGASSQARQPSEAAQGPSPAQQKRDTSGKTAANSQATGEGERSSNGTIAGGGTGSGQMVAVKNQWAQRETSVTGDAQTADDEKENEDKPSGSEQRGGVQPSLPDRTEAPSRELGINGPDDDRAGTGRGGPSPAKKARGAAALLMAVPMPDFVRGQTGPGAVAVTFEDTAPLTSPQQSQAGGPAAPRALSESAIRRFGVPWSDAAAAQAYLAQWHSHNEMNGDSAAAKSSQADVDPNSGTASTRPANGASR